MPQSQLSRWLLTRDQKNQLINGYIRQESGGVFHSVLIEVVRLFYNNLRSLQINGGNFHDFLDAKKPMVTQMFSISHDAPCQNIKFRMGIHPNGLRKNKDDAIEFYIKLKELPSIKVPVGTAPGVPAIWEQQRDRLYTLEQDQDRAVSLRRHPKWRHSRSWNLRDKLRSTTTSKAAAKSSTKSRGERSSKRSRQRMFDRVRSILSLDQSASSSADDGAMTTDDGLSSDSRSPSPSPSPSAAATAMEKVSVAMAVEAVEQIEIYYELYCQETQCEWKGVTMLTLNEYIVWSPFMMKLSECNEFGSLFFSADIDVLALHFEGGRMKPVAQPTWMNKDECFSWNIDDEARLHRIYGSGFGQCYFSPNFGGLNEDNWCCKYYPEGVKQGDGRGAIFLCLLRKPLAVKRLRVRYRIEFGGRAVVEEEKEFDAVTRCNGEWMEKVSRTKKWGQPLSFTVHVTILELYGHDDAPIDMAQWTRSGVTRLKPF